MRRLLIGILLAGAAATPALAQEQDQDGHGHRRHDQQQNNGGGQAPQAPRGEGHAARSDGGGFNRPQAPQVVHQPPVIVRQGQGGGFNRPRFEGRGNVAPQVDAQQQGYRGYRGGGFEGRRFEGRGNVAPQPQVQQQTNGYRGGYNGGERSQVDQVRNWNGQRGTWNGQSGNSYRQQQVVQQQVRQGNRWAGGGWNRDWRNNRQYDWRHYRDQHRSTFHLGVYYDPFGYGYRSFDIGYQLYQGYYAQQYWINDPWDYQLPPPPPGAVWVRYFNDALLVDMYSGQVVDAIHGFFW
jgi:Ni/Co efflux regulator RcnB